jgi:serine protease
LRVTLEHGGTTYVAHDRSGGSAHDLRLTVSVDDFVGHDARGTWTLRVVDAARADVGTLDRWQIDLTGQQLP